MNIREKIFLKLCHSPDDNEKNPGNRDDVITYNTQSLTIYKRHFGDKFLAAIQGAKILDFGCGDGEQVIGVVKEGAREAAGIEIRERCRKVAERLAREEGVSDKVEFKIGFSQDQIKSASFDLVLSQDSFEHFDDPEGIIDEFYRILRPGGKAIISFGPLWYSPYGGHIDFMTGYPWLQLVFSERTIMNARTLFRSDGAETYSGVEGGLNQMTVKRFKTILRNSQFEIEFFKILSVKNVPILARIPWVGELFSSAIATILIKR